MRDFRRLARVRSIWEMQARIETASAVRRAAEANRLASQAAERHRSALHDATGSGLVTLMTGRLATYESFSQAQQSVSHEKLRLEATRGVWRRTKQDLEVVEKLEARRIDNVESDERKRFDRQLDELAMLMRGRRV